MVEKLTASITGESSLFRQVKGAPSLISEVNGSAGTAFSPASIPNLLCWLDASDSASVSFDESSQVSVWSDKSDNAYHAVQTEVSKRPSYDGSVNGLNTLRFNGTSDSLLIAGLVDLIANNDSPHTLFFTYSPDTISQDQSIISWTNNGSSVPSYSPAIMFSATRQYISSKNPGTPINVIFGETRLGVNTLCIRVESGKIDTYLNGYKIVNQVAFAESDLSQVDSCSLGSILQATENRYFKGQICEVIAYRGGLDSAEIESSLSYLSSKWQTPAKVDFFMVGGQSNASGQGDASESILVESGNAFEISAGTLSSLQDPVGNANTGSAWPAFSAMWSKLTNRTPITLSAAIDGSGQVAGTSSNGTWEKGGTLYTAAIQSWNDNYEVIASHPDYEIGQKALLWSQGERDATIITEGNLTQAEYVAEFKRMLQGFKQDIDPYFEAYIFKTGITSSGDTVGLEAVRKGQESVVQELDYVFFAFENTIQFPFEDKVEDSIHYNQDGLNEMGFKGAENILIQRNIIRESFAPSIIDGLTLWLDPQDEDSVSFVDNKVSEIRDLSGLGNHMAQSNVALRPSIDSSSFGNRAALHFSTVGQYMSNLSMSQIISDDFTWISVVELEDLNAGQERLFSMTGGGSTDIIFRTRDTVPHDLFIRRSSGEFVSPIFNYTNNPAFIELNVNQGNVRLYRDASLISGPTFLPGSGVFSSPQALSVGANIDGSNGIVGKVGEVLVYNRALKLAERDRIYDYLSAKWSILIN